MQPSLEAAPPVVDAAPKERRQFKFPVPVQVTPSQKVAPNDDTKD